MTSKEYRVLAPEQRALLEGQNFPFRRLWRQGMFDHINVGWSTFDPWLFFTLELTLMMMYWPRYHHPGFAFVLVFLVAVFFLGRATQTLVRAYRKHQAGHIFETMHWPVYTLVAKLVALGLAIVIGQHLYW